jgi:hypothetical protein
MMRFKDTLSIILLFFGLVTPILYFFGLLYTAGWENYWGIPQGLFELDFHTVIVTGLLYILNVLVRFIVILIMFTGILLVSLIELIGIIIVGLIKNWPIVLFLLCIPLLNFIMHRLGKRKFSTYLKKAIRRIKGTIKRKYFCRFVLGRSDDLTYNPYAKDPLAKSRRLKKPAIKLFFGGLMLIIVLSCIITDPINAGCKSAERKAVSIKTDMDWVNNNSIEFENHKNSKFISLECGLTYCAVVDIKTLQVRILKTRDIRGITNPRSVLEPESVTLTSKAESLY